MDVQTHSKPQPLQLGRDAQADMVARCIRFQSSLGKFDPRISDIPGRECAEGFHAVHQLDMARQECAEAYDMLEGGWKHHKRNPKPPDRDEVLMEIVDVVTFLLNAYAYCGGQPEAELVAACTNRSDERVKLVKLGLGEAWDMGERSWRVHGGRLETLYGHGGGAHGEDWVKALATRVNHLACKIAETTETLRSALEKGPLPACSGFVYISLLPWAYACAAAVPDCTREELYGAFVHKNDVNFERQRNNY